MSASVVLVLGTRPEAIKLAPVAEALARRGLQPSLIVTGQHPQLDPADYGLNAYPAVRLFCTGQDDPHAHVRLVTSAVTESLTGCPADLLVVHGDTSSALGGALAARLAGIALAHVEAGLRSHDLRRPWPEEEFRTAIDADSQLLFAPTELSAANLRRERVRGRIHVTGNSGIDSVLAVQRGVQIPARRRKLPRLLVTCHRRENWGDGLSAVAVALKRLAADGVARIEVILHPNPALSALVRDLLGGHGSISLRRPCSHSQSIAAMMRSDLVLSDSGGMQEEASALGVPLLVLRDKTERPEAIACGAVELVGTCPERIVAAVRRRLNAAIAPVPALPFGDGRAGERIALLIDEWLEERNGTAPSPTLTAVAPGAEAPSHH